MANLITTVCYGEEKKWKSKAEATEFFTEAVAFSEGSEQSRYATILAGLLSGYTFVTDDGEWR